MTGNDLWETALAEIGEIGGGGVIILGLSGFIGKIWANHLMQRDVNHYSAQIESLKSQLQSEAENCKARLRKSEFVFQREFVAGTKLARIVSELESGWYDPWMDDKESFIDYVESELSPLERNLKFYLGCHAAILPPIVRRTLEQVRYYCISAGEYEVSGGMIKHDAAERAYDLLKEAEEKLVSVV